MLLLLLDSVLESFVSIRIARKTELNSFQLNVDGSLFCRDFLQINRLSA